MRIFIALLIVALLSLTNLLADEDSSSAELKNKLETIILPAVDFDKTPFKYTISQMQKLATSADPETDPKRKGMNFVLQGKDEKTYMTEITTHRKNVPLGEALDEIAKQAGYKVWVQQYGVVFVPKDTDTVRSLISH